MAKIKLKLVNGDHVNIDVADGADGVDVYEKMLSGSGPLVDGGGQHAWVRAGNQQVRLDAIATAWLEQ